eukprot:TRINITY_DN961_c1_g1_i1.p1 TRINITY_DN961_c1_g1~~TRINITY_DN961_c1_g1_i1.p1  ORF type:complete len:234 (-),score=20.38 TRINITY_DN961_c1_g1_i1:378-1079(-)
MNTTIDICALMQWRYSGENCTVDNFELYPVMFPLTVTVQVLSYLPCLYVFLYSAYGLYWRVFKANQNPFRIAFISDYILFIATIGKMVAFVDVYGAFGIYSYSFFVLLYFSYLLMSVTCAILAIAVWCELVVSIKTIEDRGAYNTPIIITVVSAIISVVLMVICIILGSVGYLDIAIDILNISIGVFTIFCVIMIIIYLTKISSITKLLEGQSKSVRLLKRVFSGMYHFLTPR